MKKILWWSSGADPEILMKLPSEQNKYATIGIAVILTGIVAFVTGTYSFQLIFNNFSTSILIGLVWGMLIFNIERILIQNTFSRGETISQTMLKSIPIILIVLTLTIVIIYPLVLRIFSDEIDQQLVRQTQNVVLEIEKNYNEQIVVFSDEIIKLEKNLSIKDNNVKELREDYDDELSGKGGTSVVGLGPVAKFKKEAYERAVNEYQQDKINARKRQSELKNRIEQIEIQKNLHIKDIQEQGVHSLIAKLTALSKLEKENKTIFFVRFLILFLMFLLHLLPFLSKYLSKKDLYELYLSELQTKDIHSDSVSPLLNNKPSQKISDEIEKLEKEVVAIKSVDDKSDIDEIRKLVNQLKEKKEREVVKEIELNYENYFRNSIQSVVNSMNESTRKSSNLLAIGIVIILIGILVYLAMIFFWLDEFHTNSFQTYHVFGLVSTSLLFLFIEFLGAWFLKQHRRVAEETIYFMEFKSIIEKNFLAYLFIKENTDENKFELQKSLIELFKSDIKLPSRQDVSDSSFAQDAMGTISNLTDSVKKLIQK